MKDLMIQKGFKLTECSDGKFWAFIVKDADRLDELNTRLEGYDLDYSEMFIIQTDEDIKHFTIMIDCNVWELTETQFVDLVKKLEVVK